MPKEKHKEYIFIGWPLLFSCVLHFLVLFVFAYNHIVYRMKINPKQKNEQHTKVVFISEPKRPVAIAPAAPMHVVQQQLTSQQKLKSKQQELKSKAKLLVLSEKKLVKQQSVPKVKTFLHPSHAVSVSSNQQDEQSLSSRIQKTLDTVLPKRKEMVKKRKNILSMTRNMISNLRNKSMCIESKGEDRDLTPNELKDLHYLDQIASSVRSAWVIHFRNLRFMRVEATIRFVIDSNGKLIDLKLVRTSGRKEFDDAVMESVRRASPFPPIPKMLKTKLYVKQMTVYI